MNRIMILQIVLCAAIVGGCSRNDIDMAPSVEQGAATDPISFGVSELWTKGAEVNSISDVPELTMYSYFVEGSTWSTLTSGEDLISYFSDGVSAPNTLTQDEDNTASYAYSGDTKYWPNGDEQYLNFFVYYPSSELEMELDENTDYLPKFSYSMDGLSRNNHDLVVDALWDMTQDSDKGNVGFTLQHALSKLSLQVKLTGTLNSDGAAYAPLSDETDSNYEAADYDSYTVNGIVFYGLYKDAVLSIDASGDSRVISWTVDTSSTTNLYSSTNQTLKSIDAYTNDPLTTSGYTSVMAENQAIFALPQLLGDSRSDGAPTAMVSIQRTYYTDQAKQTQKQIVYETQSLEIPVADGTTGWEPGMHYKLSFDFDIDNLSDNDTPLTISSQIMSWTEATVEADIHANLYTYASDKYIAVEGNSDDGYYGELMICTNYDYNLRVPHHREELGGTITSSRGFLFCSPDFPEATSSIGEVSTGLYGFVPTMLTTGDNPQAIYYVTEDYYADDIATIEQANASLEEGEEEAKLTDTVIIDGATEEDKEIFFGSNGYAYILHTNGLYRLLYFDPDSGEVTAFNYDNDEATGYHEIDLTPFEDTTGTINFLVEIDESTIFNMSIRRSTREDEGLYTSTAIVNTDGSTDSAYGINKQSGDAVYIIRLSVDPVTLGTGTFEDVIGVEMISNGGGMVTQLFSVVVENTDGAY